MYRIIHDNAVKDNDFDMIRETNFIDSIETLQDLKDYVKTNDYWADMASVSIIEKLLKIKVLLLSKNMFDAGNISRIVNCGNNLQADKRSRCSISGIDSDDHSRIKSSEILLDSDISIVEKVLDAHGLNYTNKTDKLKLYKTLSHKFRDVVVSPAVIPDKFIILHYEDGIHYKLIAVDGKTQFTKFKQIPKKLRNTIIEKCGKMKELSKFM